MGELIEAHAVDTYAQFADQNEDILSQLPPPRIARDYYEGPDLYMFDEFQTSRDAHSRRPSVRNLHDVFCNIRDDEGEHVKTMNACQDENSMLKSPNTVNAVTAAVAVAVSTNVLAETVGEGLTAIVEADDLLQVILLGLGIL